MTRRTATSCLGALAGTLLLAPAAAEAHGLVQRADLPIPESLFAAAASVVLIVSFLALAVLWPRPKLESQAEDWRPLYKRPRGLDASLLALGVATFAVLVVAGFVGPEVPLENLLSTFVFIVFWVGFVFASILFGDVFHAVNPWRGLGLLLVRRRTRPYPQRLGRWPAALGLLAFTWLELVSGAGQDNPDVLATAVVVYTVITLAGCAAFGTESWIRNAEAFSVYFNFFSRLSPWETRDGVTGLRAPLSGLTRLEALPGTVAVVCVMIGTVTFDGFSQGSIWADATAGMGERLAGTVGLLLGVAAIAAFYVLGIAGARTVGGDIGAARLRMGFVHSLVPIAVVYVIAHYLTLLVFGGQAMAYLVSDPFGQGWDLLGTASTAIDYSVMSQNLTWYLQVGFVVLGHVAALVLAHDRALVLYGQARLAVRSQYWMLLIMVGFTTLALWLLAQANA